MKNRTKKLLSMTLAAAMCVFALAACSGGGSTTPAQSASSAETQTTQEDTSTTETSVEDVAEASLRELYASISSDPAYIDIDSLPELGSGNGYTIGCAMTNVSTGWFKALYDLLYEQLTAAGCEVILVECDDDANKQVDQIETFIAQNVDGIIMNPANPQETVTTVLEQVADAGIPVISVDVPPEEGAQYMTANVTAAYELGKLVGAEVARKALEANPEGEIPFGIIGGTDGNSIAASRNAGERDGVKEVDTEGRMVEVAFLYAGAYSEESGLTTAQNMLAAHPELKVIIGTCDPHVVGATSAAEQLGLAENLVMGAIDGSRAAFEIMMDNGPIVASGVNSAYEVAEAAAREMVGYLRDGYVPSSKTMQMQPTLVTPENVADFYNPDQPY